MVVACRRPAGPQSPHKVNYLINYPTSDLAWTMDLVSTWMGDSSRILVAFAPSWYLTTLPGQLNMTISPYVGKMNTGDRWSRPLLGKKQRVLRKSRS